MMITLVLSTISLMIPMSLLKRLPFIMGVADTLNCNIFIVNFIITNRQAHPIVHFHTLFSKSLSSVQQWQFHHI